MTIRYDKLAAAAPAVVRIAMALVFLWFGSSQLLQSANWTAWLPQWTSALPVDAITLVRLNGAFEIVFGALLLLGLYTRFVAFFLALHMFHIAFTVGYGEIGVRDFGLACATTSVFLRGADNYTLDTFLSRSSGPAKPAS